MRVLKTKFSIAAAVSLTPSIAQALPIGFGHTQSGLTYNETANQDFIVYHDQETTNEARSVLNSLTAGKQILESWMQVKRTTPMPVVMSSIAAGASFANFITDAIELQTLGQGERDLYWHELTHATMYRHLDNWLGPAGSVIHLPWMPTWFIEGLPEALTVSTGSDIQAAYERFHALAEKWPTYDRLHSLYGGQGFASEGYATSGAFVSYILKTYGPEKLPTILKRFYYNSMPWYWPWALVPFGPFLPMDDALKEATGKDGRELYAEYQKAAQKYWAEHSQGSFLYQRPGKREEWSPGVSMWQSGNHVYFVQNDNGTYRTREIDFKDSKGWARSKTAGEYPEDNDDIQFVKLNDGVLTIKNGGFSGARATEQNIVYTNNAGSRREIATAKGFAGWTAASQKRFIWTEYYKEQTKICYAERASLTTRKTGKLPAKCLNKIVQPQLFTLLGAEYNAESEREPPTVKTLWYATHDQKLIGESHTVYRWDVDSEKGPQAIPFKSMGKPRSMAFAGKQRWLLVGEQTHQSLRMVDDQLNCLGVIPFADLIVKAWGFDDGSVSLRIRAGATDQVIRLAPDELPTRSCYDAGEHISPMLVATRNQNKISIQQAFKLANLWSAEKPVDPRKVEEMTAAAPSLAQTGKDDAPATPARTRYRPVFAVPWVGADALGYNFGTLGVPLMDHMQNETLTLMALFGIESKDPATEKHIGRYPSLELSLVSTRFLPILKVDAFRYGAYNGEVGGSTSYVDERGFRLSGDFYNAWTDSSYELGIQTSFLQPYLGSENIRGGQLNLALAAFSKSKSFSQFDLSFRTEAKIAPGSSDSDFDYNQLEFNLSMARSFDFLSSRLSLGFNTSRTRGPKSRDLQEMYQPLRTYIPGSGGGFNNQTFPLSEFCLNPEDETYCPRSVFASKFGENQMRLSANYTFPIISNFEKLIRMFYLKSIEFGSFFNYGGAWSGHLLPTTGTTKNSKGEELDPDLIAAVGANADLLFELNGVKFNVGLGSGKDLHQEGKISVFMRVGFDSVLEVNKN